MLNLPACRQAGSASLFIFDKILNQVQDDEFFMKTVALDVSPINSGHSLRGVGFYTKKLYEYFLSNKGKFDVKIEFFNNGKIPKKADLVHYPYFDPFFLTLPFFKKTKRIITVHDLIPLVFPGFYPRGVRGEIKWRIQKLALKKSEAIITDSINSKKDIIKIISYPGNKIYPIYLSPAEIYRKLEAGNWKLEIKNRLNLPEKFILYVGDVNYNKNVAGLIKAFEKLKATVKNLKLVLVGSAFLNKNLSETDKIDELIKELSLENEIIKPGYVSDDDLVKIYNLASAYIQPSFYEGFGLPVLEAMACGCPVVSSCKSSLPEIAGEAVLYFNPDNPPELRDRIDKILTNNFLRKQLIIKGLIQVKKFSWDKTGNETINLYQKLLS